MRARRGESSQSVTARAALRRTRVRLAVPAGSLLLGALVLMAPFASAGGAGVKLHAPYTGAIATFGWTTSHSGCGGRLSFPRLIYLNATSGVGYGGVKVSAKSCGNTSTAKNAGLYLVLNGPMFVAPRNGTDRVTITWTLTGSVVLSETVGAPLTNASPGQSTGASADYSIGVANLLWNNTTLDCYSAASFSTGFVNGGVNSNSNQKVSWSAQPVSTSFTCSLVKGRLYYVDTDFSCSVGANAGTNNSASSGSCSFGRAAVTSETIT